MRAAVVDRAAAMACERQDREDRAALRELGDDDLVSRAGYLQRELTDVAARLADGVLDEAAALIISLGFGREHDLVDQELARRCRLLERGASWYRAPQRVPGDFARELKERLGADGFADLVAGYHGGAQLRRSGTRYVGLCPFHSETTPSFTIFGDGGWRCFGCGEGGDVYSFLRLRGLGWVESVRIVAGYLGVPMPHRRRPVSMAG